MQLELELNVVKGSLSSNKISKSFRFLTCIVLRGIISYVCISESFLCLENALLKEFIFTRTYFCSPYKFGQTIKNYFREKLEQSVLNIYKQHKCSIFNYVIAGIAIFICWLYVSFVDLDLWILLIICVRIERVSSVAASAQNHSCEIAVPENC